MLHYAEVPEWEVWGFYEMKNTIAAILGLSDGGYCCLCYLNVTVAPLVSMLSVMVKVPV